MKIWIIRIALNEMAQVIPAIIAKDFEELKEKLEKIKPYSSWAQIDISDGIFTKNITWNNPKDLQNLETDLNLEIHLMVVQSEKYFGKWIHNRVKRIIVHVSSKDDYEKIKLISESLKNKNIQLGIGLNTDVSIEEIKNLVPLASTILLLAVTPGFSGQNFQNSVLEKIEKLRKLYPNAKIEIDGGINPKTAKDCLERGANILVSASYIFNSKNIKEAIESLRYA